MKITWEKHVKMTWQNHSLRFAHLIWLKGENSKLLVSYIDFRCTRAVEKSTKFTKIGKFLAYQHLLKSLQTLPMTSASILEGSIFSNHLDTAFELFSICQKIVGNNGRKYRDLSSFKAVKNRFM